MGNATETIVRYGRRKGGQYANICTLAPSAIYATGGETVAAASCGLGAIDSVDFHSVNGIYVPEWDQTNTKMKVRYLSTGAEYGAGEDISAITFRCTVYGTGPVGG